MLTKILLTCIWFKVNVPVLSLHITLTHPNVSTLCNFLTIAFTLLRRWTPSDKTIVTTANNPSGITATAKEIAVINISTVFLFCKKAIKKIKAHKKTVEIARTVDISFILFWRGVLAFFSFFNNKEILPICVSLPVLVTIASPLPLMTLVPLNTIFFISPSGIVSVYTSFSSFNTGTDSPVNKDSSTINLLDFIILASEAILSPALNTKISPITTSFVGIWVTILFRLT